MMMWIRLVGMLSSFWRMSNLLDSCYPNPCRILGHAIAGSWHGEDM
jgi:hypothetical protein